MRGMTIAADCAVVIVVDKADVLAGQNKASGSEAAFDCGASYVDRYPANQLRTNSSCLTIAILIMCLLSIQAIAMTRLK
jgi:hypothetical protein